MSHVLNDFAAVGYSTIGLLIILLTALGYRCSYRSLRKHQKSLKAGDPRFGYLQNAINEANAGAILFWSIGILLGCRLCGLALTLASPTYSAVGLVITVVVIGAARFFWWLIRL
jgi:hypothetical protein